MPTTACYKFPDKLWSHLLDLDLLEAADEDVAWSYMALMGNSNDRDSKLEVLIQHLEQMCMPRAHRDKDSISVSLGNDAGIWV